MSKEDDTEVYVNYCVARAGFADMLVGKLTKGDERLAAAIALGDEAHSYETKVSEPCMVLTKAELLSRVSKLIGESE